MIAKLICWLSGHKWRRMTRAESIQARIENKPYIKICRRCSAERAVRARKTKDLTRA